MASCPVLPAHVFRGLAALADAQADAGSEADGDLAGLVVVGHVGAGGRARRGEGGAAGGGRLSARPEAVRAARRARSEGDPSPRPAGHRQDARCQGGGERVGCALLRAERLGVRRDVRRPRCGTDPEAVRRSAQERTVDRLYRRARRGRPDPQRPLVQPGAGSDAEPAARGVGRLRCARSGGRDGRVEPAPGSRPRTPASRSLRSADPDPAARSEGSHRDSPRAHARKAALAGGRRRGDGAADSRADRCRSGEPLQRGGDRGRPLRPAGDHASRLRLRDGPRRRGPPAAPRR